MATCRPPPCAPPFHLPNPSEIGQPSRLLLASCTRTGLCHVEQAARPLGAVCTFSAMKHGCARSATLLMSTRLCRGARTYPLHRAAPCAAVLAFPPAIVKDCGYVHEGVPHVRLRICRRTPSRVTRTLPRASRSTCLRGALCTSEAAAASRMQPGPRRSEPGRPARARSDVVGHYSSGHCV